MPLPILDWVVPTLDPEYIPSSPFFISYTQHLPPPLLTHIMQPKLSDSKPSSPELGSKALFEDAELVNTNTGKTTSAKPPDPYSMSHPPHPSS